MITKTQLQEVVDGVKNALYELNKARSNEEVCTQHRPGASVLEHVDAHIEGAIAELDQVSTLLGIEE